VPRQVRRLFGECLQKDPKLRLRDIGDAKRLLEASTPASAAAQSRFSWAMAATMTAISLVLAFVVLKHLREGAPHVVQFPFAPPNDGDFPPELPSMSVSPDGQRIAFEVVGNGNPRTLWWRELSEATPRMLTRLSGAEAPIWAPDSHRLAFLDRGQLWKIDVNGGPAVPLAPVVGTAPILSGSWNKDDVIIFAKVLTPLFRISANANGGSPEPITELDKARGEIEHREPSFLPDGHHFLYLALSADPEKNAVYVGDLASKMRKQVLAFGTRAIYVKPGYLLYVRDRTLMAQPFDTGNLELRGDAVPIPIDQIDVSQGTMGHFSASENGVLAYTSGGAVGDGQLTWLDHSGKKLGTVGPPGSLGAFSLSRDDSAVVYARVDAAGRSDLWSRSLVSNSGEHRLTFTGNNQWPVFSADASQLFFESDRDGDYKVYRTAANGTGSDEVIIDPRHQFPTDASPDFLFTNSSPDERDGGHIWVHPLSGNSKPTDYVPPTQKFNETNPRISPNGNFLAYQSTESGQPEVYVVSFPHPDKKWTISNGGGRAPVWSRAGTELYHYSRDNKIMAVEFTPGKQTFGVREPLFPVRFSGSIARFEVSREGRFLVRALLEQQASASMTVVLNWPEMLKKK
jgi:serine/threonine-protein kinase